MAAPAWPGRVAKRTSLAGLTAAAALSRVLRVVGGTRMEMKFAWTNRKVVEVASRIRKTLEIQ
jgi:hypothetical protein